MRLRGGWDLLHHEVPCVGYAYATPVASIRFYPDSHLAVGEQPVAM